MNLLVTGFLIAYFLNPHVSYFPFENMRTFVTLRSLAWAIPPAILRGRDAAWYVQLTGDILLPVTFCGIFVGVAANGLRRGRGSSPREEPRPIFRPLANNHIRFIAATAVAIATSYLLIKVGAFGSLATATPYEHDFGQYGFAGNMPLPGVGSAFDIPLILLLMAAMGSVWAWQRPGYREETTVTRDD